ncbi:GCN5-related N-acetyltransferas-like protein [Melanomma pulvis-pyrius CBS 109.77]|uniref:GCN5-related N-acetyltransferas-like protein n=1 Tax=Melanomma pulvis-pyrius CBS 109.77 TaxID=1314802 RepID=A0A6A6WRR4_9PLEO|nr:GCN5-related N-acetyltransferas-like protein [Melanomma pulvis-pyrius CBS 109.77]
MSGLFIRPYEARDWDAGLHIFFTTIDSSVNFEPARTIGSYIWFKSYVLLTPGTCFVLDDGTGRAVGYIIGTASTNHLIERWKEVLVPMVDPKLVPKPEVSTGDAMMERDDVRELRGAVYAAQCNMLESTPHLLEQYPAHLHINVLPEFQSSGFGRRLMDTFLQKLRDLGSGGVHLGMVASNANARRFYERLGFQLCDGVLDDGESGEVGRQGHAICLVKKL